MWGEGEGCELLGWCVVTRSPSPPLLHRPQAPLFVGGCGQEAGRAQAVSSSAFHRKKLGPNSLLIKSTSFVHGTEGCIK